MVEIRICDKEKGDVCIQCTPEQALERVSELSKKGMIVIDADAQKVYRDGDALNGQTYIAQWPAMGG
ncbi:MAG: hypothetical protein HXS54_05890 [Theionarchaea archaeon]|nr:hypothetical protein [Theionarchaea archaeon]DBA34899.1 TPA_asm: hypothetical protein vir521_00105 [Caudoviricetes sp. vir521]